MTPVLHDQIPLFYILGRRPQESTAPSRVQGILVKWAFDLSRWILTGRF
jgi:hypothetical protein